MDLVLSLCLIEFPHFCLDLGLAIQYTSFPRLIIAHAPLSLFSHTSLYLLLVLLYLYVISHSRETE